MKDKKHFQKIVSSSSYREMSSKIWNAVLFLWRNPLCGINLRIGAYCVAVTQMVLTLMKVVAFITGAYFQIRPSKGDKYSRLSSGLDRIFFLMLTCGLLSQIFWFTLNSFLIRGIRASKVTTVDRVWILMVVVTIADVVSTGLVMIFMSQSVGFGLVEGLTLAFDLFSIWVVSAYKRELKRGAFHMGGGGQKREMRDTDSTRTEFEIIV